MPDRLSSPSFVGRAEELAELDATLDAALGGTPATLLVGGEAGVGKSRLVEEFAARARVAGARTLVGECLELTGEGLPYAPFTALLRALMRELGADEVARRSGRGAAALARVLPELGEPQPVDDPTHAQAQLFEHLLLLVEDLARERPLVLAVEDAHWAGASTRDLLVFLIRSIRAVPILLLVTYRSDELHRTHPLRPVLAELERTRGVERLELERFGRAEVRDQIAGIRGEEPAPPMVDAVLERTDGNPLFVEELVCCRRSSVEALRDAGLSQSLRDLLLSHVERLPEPSQAILRVAAVGGTNVDHDLLAAVTGASDAELAAALRPAVEDNVLVPDHVGYQFRHGLIQEAVYQQLLPGERTRLHATYAEALSGSDPTRCGRATSVAHHWYAAFDVERALAAAWSAAAAAERAAAHSERLAMLERVLELWERVPDAAERLATTQAEVLELAVDAATLAGDVERGWALSAAALAEIEPAREPERVALLRLRRAKILRSLGRAGAMDELGEAERLVRPLPAGPVLAKTLAARAMGFALKPVDLEAHAYAAEALAVARAVGEVESEVNALVTLAYVADHVGDVDEAFAQLDRARALVDGDDRTRQWISVAINRSDLHESVGEHAKAAEVAQAAVSHAEDLGLARTMGAFLAINTVEPFVSLGRWDEAVAIIDDVVALDPPPSMRGLLLILRAWISATQGDPEPASRDVAAARAVFADRVPSAQELLPLATVEAEVALAEGRPADALDVVERALDDKVMSNSRRYVWPLLSVGARAAADLSARSAALRDDVAARRVERAVAVLDQSAGSLLSVGPTERARRLTVEAELRRIKGATDPADWDAAADAWRTAAHPYEQARTLVRAAEAAAGAGDRSGAARRLTQARETADALGAKPLRLAVDRLAARARIRVEPGTTTLPGDAHEAGEAPDAVARLGLTAREVEVLRLVAAGLTNPQIAQQLFISAKTVSVHVSRILAKLDVTGRGEAAAAAHRMRMFDEETPASA